MPIVVDTSISLAWTLPDELSERADAVLDVIMTRGITMVAPRLWIEETSNALVAAHRRGRITEAEVVRAIEVLGNLRVEVSDQGIDRSALVASALRSGLSAYDATYLVLAERTGASLATLDRRLGEAAGAAGVEVLPGR